MLKIKTTRNIKTLKLFAISTKRNEKLILTREYMLTTEKQFDENHSVLPDSSIIFYQKLISDLRNIPLSAFGKTV